MRLIDADKLLDAISVHLERIEQEIDDAQTIDTAPIIEEPVYLDTEEVTKKVIEKLAGHGHWEIVGRDTPWLKKCSECGTHVDNAGTDWCYCPNCGARMDGGTEDDG